MCVCVCVYIYTRAAFTSQQDLSQKLKALFVRMDVDENASLDFVRINMGLKKVYIYFRVCLQMDTLKYNHEYIHTNI